MAISHCYWHLVVKEWQLTDVLLDLLADLPHKCIMGYILWDLFGNHFGFLKKRWWISCYLWINRVENSQLALYSHVICNPSSTLPHNTLQMTITNFNYEGSYVPGLICNTVVKANLGRSPGRTIPPNASWDIYYGMYFDSHFGLFKKRWQFPFISV